MTLINTYIKGNSPQGIVLAQLKPGTLLMKDCLFVNYNPKAVFSISPRKEPAKYTFNNVKVIGYKKVISNSEIKDIKSIKDIKESEKILKEKRAYFFSLFNGQLEKAIKDIN